jgi:hypothetical protein
VLPGVTTFALTLTPVVTRTVAVTVRIFPVASVSEVQSPPSPEHEIAGAVLALKIAADAVIVIFFVIASASCGTILIVRVPGSADL